MWQGAQECAFAMAPDAGPVRHPRAQYRCKRFSMVDCRVLVMSHDSWLVCRKPCTDLVALHHPPPGYISFDWPQLVSAPVPPVTPYVCLVWSQSHCGGVEL